MRPQILHQLGGPVGLNAGGSPVNGILPVRRFISGSETVDVNLDVRLLRDRDHIILEILCVESNHVRIQIGEQFRECGASSASGMTLRDGRNARTPFRKARPP